ncbi:MAG TPA: VPLPA-CTERM sorting domain-containing protein [Steroidobacteraceae bacterium]|nr:VPLPA-CTERM sorting domain-containing protein [Steroidobacteraceae bacterium]
MKVGAASALAMGAVAAHASIASPSSGASDAILFAEVVHVNGDGTTSAVASYAGDTGVSMNSLVAGLSSATTVLGSDANLAKLFAADAAGDTLWWSVQGGQWTGSATALNFGTKGNAKFITTTVTDASSGIAQRSTQNLIKWAGLANDVGTINGLNGGANSIESNSPVTGGQWDQLAPSSASGWYNNGPVTGNTLGTPAHSLFYVTGNGSLITSKVSYSTAAETVSLSSSGLAFSPTGGSPPPVPLPAAVWLFGSGLLGLTGIARRKSKA